MFTPALPDLGGQRARSPALNLSNYGYARSTEDSGAGSKFWCRANVDTKTPKLPIERLSDLGLDGGEIRDRDLARLRGGD